MSIAKAVEEVIAALRRIGVRYLVGGSQASSALGVPRSTLDTDIVADLSPQMIPALARAVGADWYIDVDSARNSTARYSGQSTSLEEESCVWSPPPKTSSWPNFNGIG